MNDLSNEKIQAILDGAPEGAVAFDVRELLGGYSAAYHELHNLSDLREILALRQRVQELKRYKYIADSYLDIYNCKKCNGLVNRGHICFSCGDSNPSEKERSDG